MGLNLNRVVIGADAASEWTGLALVAAGTCRLLPVRAHDDRKRTWDERLLPAVTQLAEAARGLGAVIRVAIEEPPVTSRAKGRQGSQGGVGYGIGRSCGLVEAAAYVAGLQVVYVPVSDWRWTRERLARQLGVRTPNEAGHGFSRLEDGVADKHKAYSYTLAARLWPDAVAALVAQAAERSRKVSAADTPWRLASVSDACEAALIALHVGMMPG